MPNWCRNHLYIQGDQRQRLLLLEQVGYFSVEGRILDFESIIPYPGEYFEAIGGQFVKSLPDEKKTGFWNAYSAGYNNGGYYWCITNWGTKWNSYDVQYLYDAVRDTIIVIFDTAWGPPQPIFAKLSEQYPMLQIEAHWFEQGMAFMGGQLLSPSYFAECEIDPSIAVWSGSYRGMLGG